MRFDSHGLPQPDIAEGTGTSPDGTLYNFSIRKNALWHDGQPVTSDDCIASIKRWGARDSLGQKLLTFVDAFTAKDVRTFEIKLKSPTGLVLAGLAKPSSNAAFMMPKRVADTDPNKQIDDATGSGPFVFKKDEWKPGDKAVAKPGDRAEKKEKK